MKCVHLDLATAVQLCSDVFRMQLPMENGIMDMVPVITSVICIVCMAFFDLDKKYDQVVADLAEVKHRTDK